MIEWRPLGARVECRCIRGPDAAANATESAPTSTQTTNPERVDRVRLDAGLSAAIRAACSQP